eukprot:586516-Pelagomonas_calceolata.AAC.2
MAILTTTSARNPDALWVPAHDASQKAKAKAGPTHVSRKMHAPHGQWVPAQAPVRQRIRAAGTHLGALVLASGLPPQSLHY